MDIQRIILWNLTFAPEALGTNIAVHNSNDGVRDDN
jgi:hypothetical protein